MSTPTERFEVYLRRHTVCRGGVVTAEWDEAGGAVLVTEDGRRRRIDLATGESADMAPPTAPPVSPMWNRFDYLFAMPVPEVPSPDGRWRAAVVDHNLVLRSTGGAGTIALTHDGTDDLRWDVEAQRFRVGPGLTLDVSVTSPWRPDSQALIACRHDIGGVFRMPTINWLARPEEVSTRPAPKAGAKINAVEAFLVDVRNGDARPIRFPGQQPAYVLFLGWTRDGAEARLMGYSRDFKAARVIAVDGQTASARELLFEQGDTFVRLQHEALFYGQHGVFLLDDGGFLWLSERSGYAHIYRYDRQGKHVARLTDGAWPVMEIYRVGEGWVYFGAHCDSRRPYDVHVCRVPLAGGAHEQLTQEPGVHVPNFSPSGALFLDRHSSVDRPVTTMLRRCDGTPVAAVARMDIGALEEAGYRAAEEFVVLAADGETPLWGVMYKPADFDPRRRYPVLQHIYGGPQVTYAQRHFSVSPLSQLNLPWALAQLGYIVVSLDARGTPGRSKAFQDVVYRNWGGHVIPDHAAGLRQLIDRHEWMDAGRVGIFGHSWGGYFSTAALIEAPDLYRAAVSSSPGYDPWDSILYEPYLDLPSRDRRPYDGADLLRHAGRVRGNLMIVAGTGPGDASPLSSAMKMSHALINASVQHELVLLHGQGHDYEGPALDFFVRKLVNWFERHVMLAGPA